VSVNEAAEAVASDGLDSEMASSLTTSLGGDVGGSAHFPVMGASGLKPKLSGKTPVTDPSWMGCPVWNGFGRTPQPTT
jgi:hypothetical protein